MHTYIMNEVTYVDTAQLPQERWKNKIKNENTSYIQPRETHPIASYVWYTY